MISRSPWWIDYNHAPPGAGYMHLLFLLLTTGRAGEHHREVAGENRFAQSGCGTNFTGAELTFRLRGELRSAGARLHLLVQGVHDGICTGWMLTGQSLEVGAEWSERTLTAVEDESAWTCLGVATTGRTFTATHRCGGSWPM